MATHGSTHQEDISRIPVAYLILGFENNRKAIIDFHRNARTMINWVADPNFAKVDSKIGWIWNEILAARRRGVRCRKITEITKDNLSHCKESMTKIDELRHLEVEGASFAVSDIEFVAMVPSIGSKEEPYIQFIYSDSESMVSHKQLIFDVVWKRATPAQSRISELEGSNAGGDIGKSAAIKPGNVIDRIYACTECRQTFIYRREVEEHKKATGHNNYRDFPLV